MNLHLLPTIMPRVDVDIKLTHLFRNEFSGTDFYLMGSISTRRSNSQFSIFSKQVHALIITIKNNIHAASQLSVCTCRILSFIEHVYCFFRSSKFQLGCILPRVVLFSIGPAHDDNGAQRSSRYLLASGPPALVIFCLTTSARSFFY